MPNSVYVGGALYFSDTRAVGCDPANQIIQRRRNVAQGSRELLSGFAAFLKRNNRLTTDALNLTTAEAVVFVPLNPLEVGGDDLELQAGTSGVQYEDVHDGDSLPGST